MNDDRSSGWLPSALRRLETRLGADREGRTLWVWVVPGATLVITFVVLAFIGVEGKVDLALTIPMALTLSVFLASLSAFYLTAASADERDRDDGPDDRPGPSTPPPAPRPHGGDAVPTVVTIPERPRQGAEPRTPVGSGAPRG